MVSLTWTTAVSKRRTRSSGALSVSRPSKMNSIKSFSKGENHILLKIDLILYSIYLNCNSYPEFGGGGDRLGVRGPLRRKRGSEGGVSSTERRAVKSI